MGLVYSRTSSGLVLAEHGQDEAAVARALRDYDPDLRLVRQLSEAWGCHYWGVYRYAGPDRPAELVCAWMSDHGDPYPLSMRLLDLVKQLDANTRSEYLSADERNARMRAQRRADWEAEMEALREDWLMPHGRPVLPRSQSLRMARDKQRARGKRV